MQEDKKVIVEAYADSLKEDNYPPVAGKILGVLFISNQKYFTFESLMEEVDASKSAISKGLKLLLHHGEIGFIKDKENSRKRLFYLDIKGNIARTKRLIDALQVKTQLLEEILTHRNKDNAELNQYIETSVKFSDEILGYIDHKIKEHF